MPFIELRRPNILTTLAFAMGAPFLLPSPGLPGALETTSLAIAPSAAGIIDDAPANDAEEPAADIETDRELERRVLLRLLRSRALANAEIDVGSSEGLVRLSGRVATERALETARRIAERTFGVHGVESELTIDPELDRAEHRKDERIAREAARLLATLYPSVEIRDTWLYGWEIRSDDWEIELDVDDGTVMLSGRVPTRADVARCVSAIHGVDGVKSVYSDLAWVDTQGAEALPYPRGYYPYGYPPSHPLGAYPYPWDWSSVSAPPATDGTRTIDEALASTRHRRLS